MRAEQRADLWWAGACWSVQSKFVLEGDDVLSGFSVPVCEQFEDD